MRALALALAALLALAPLAAAAPLPGTGLATGKTAMGCSSEYAAVGAAPADVAWTMELHLKVSSPAGSPYYIDKTSHGVGTSFAAAGRLLDVGFWALAEGTLALYADGILVDSAWCLPLQL